MPWTAPSCPSTGRFLGVCKHLPYNVGQLHTPTHSGGGFFLDNCQLDFDGGEAPTDGHHGSIAGNKASTGQGGGIAAEGGADVTLRGMASGAPAYLVNNEATAPVSGAGGGLSLEGSGTEAHLWNSTVSGNTTGGPGGGVHVGSGAHFNMEADFTRCGLGKLCSILADNRSGGLPGGGLDIKLAARAFTEFLLAELARLPRHQPRLGKAGSSAVAFGNPGSAPPD